jgi:hypothetical protein
MVIFRIVGIRPTFGLPLPPCMEAIRRALSEPEPQQPFSMQ